MDLDERIVELVREVKSAIVAADTGGDNGGMTVSRVDLELKTTFSGGIGGEAKVFKLVDIGASVSRAQVQTISLSLVPRAGAVELMHSVDEELKEGIEVVKSAVREAASSAPAFDLREATVSVNMTVDAEGKVRIFFGPEGKWENVHSATLTLTPAVADASPFER
jgi:hypothetical protein